jgi:flagellar motility protein MotE (MotC chaperone)
MTRLLRSSWFIALVSCVLYLATTAALIRPESVGELPATQAASRSANDDPSWRFRNPEFEQWIAELKSERAALETRAQQLKELQTRLDAERQEVLAYTQVVHQLQVEFDKNVIRLKEQSADNIKRQVKIIAGMSPEGAANMLNEMPDDEIVHVLFLLKPDQASPILDAMSKMGKAEAKRAAVFTEQLRKVVSPSPGTTGKGAQG